MVEKIQTLEEQAIACLNCAANELISQDSERLPAGKWPAWEPGLQAFPCPKCQQQMVWATEPREHSFGELEDDIIE